MNRSSPQLRLVLIGPDQQDNLALGYLAASAEAAGHRVEMVSFNTPTDSPACVATTMAANPDVIGLGVPFQSTVSDYLDLSQALRAAGFLGHLTCGGHVPTFCSREMLEACPQLDSAVRHEGEVTLVELMERLGRGESPRGVQGVVWRDDDGGIVQETARPLVRELENLPRPIRREEPLAVGGVPIAFLITSRGCLGDCAYCSIRAFNRDAGGPPYRLRPADDVAEEVAELRQMGVRVFFVQDDLFILPREKQTLQRITALREALDARGVSDIFFWIKGKPECITTGVLEAAKTLGTLHVFIGLESASAEQLGRLGRTHQPADNERAIQNCRETGILPSFNFMLFDPDGTLEDVSQTLDLAERNLDLSWNVCRTEIYPGTHLETRLRSQGRLEGDWRSAGYRIADDAAEVMFRVMRVCFHERAFNFDSLLNRLISLSFARQVHGALFPGDVTNELDVAVRELLIDVHRDCVERMRRYADFASSTPITAVDRIRGFAVSEALAVNSADLRWHARFGELWDFGNKRGSARTRAR